MTLIIFIVYLVLISKEILVRYIHSCSQRAGLGMERFKWTIGWFALRRSLALGFASDPPWVHLRQCTKLLVLMCSLDKMLLPQKTAWNHASKISWSLGCWGGDVRLQGDPRASSMSVADSFPLSVGTRIALGLNFWILTFSPLLHPLFRDLTICLCIQVWQRDQCIR